MGARWEAARHSDVTAQASYQQSEQYLALSDDHPLRRRCFPLHDPTAHFFLPYRCVKGACCTSCQPNGMFFFWGKVVSSRWNYKNLFTIAEAATRGEKSRIVVPVQLDRGLRSIAAGSLPEWAAARSVLFGGLRCMRPGSFPFSKTCCWASWFI